MGSVKDLQVIKVATQNEFGVGRFKYSNRYSVFDWGNMPDSIPNKGKAIAILGAYFFEKLEKMGIPTHYIGMIENNELKKLSELNQAVDTIQIKLLQVHKPNLDGNSYDYSMYHVNIGGMLIPLEIIYRNTLPAGSSVFKRLEKGQIKPRDMGLDKLPKAGQKLKSPFIDVSTKLEITDRYLSWVDATLMAGLSKAEVSKIKEITNTINKLITSEFSNIGLVNEDGKIELGFDHNRNIILIDVLGTLDECRFTYNEIPVSKEIARIYYRNSEWHKATEEAKTEDRQNWKEICKHKPEKLPSELKKLISLAYCACTNEITKREWFIDIPPLKEVLAKIDKILKNKR